MKKIKTGINAITGISMIALAVINIIIFKSGCVYRPKSYILFGAVYFVLAAGITFFSIKYKNDACKTSKIFGSFLPLISLLYAITLMLSFDLSIDYITYSILYYELLFAITVIFSLVIFFVYTRPIWLKIAVGACSLGLGVIFVFVLFVTLVFANFGEDKILQTLNSPDDTYVAMSVSYDDGALGGDTCVRVRDKKHKISLLIGRITRREQTPWTGDWGNVPTIEWEDDDTILINGFGYDVK